MIGRALILALCVPTFLPSPLWASSVRTETANRLKMIGLAFWDYHSVLKRFPNDLKDAEGKRILSWRVGVLPFVEEDQLHRQFKLSNSWDDLANERFIAEMPRIYQSHQFAAPKEKGLAGFAMPRGPKTFWGETGQRTAKDFKRDPTTIVLLVEVAETEELVWTAPRDLQFNPENPKKGLGWHWHLGRFSNERGCLALFADGSVRMIPEFIDDDYLRRLFDPEAELTASSLTWSEMFLRKPVDGVLLPALGISIVALLGLIIVGDRFRVGQLPAPGEML